MIILYREQSNISIREAISTEGTVISKLLYESFLEYQKDYTSKAFAATAIDSKTVRQRMEEGPVWVATINDKVAGTASLVIGNDEMYVRGMAVHPKYRGKKIGWALLENIEIFAKENDCTRLILYTTPFLHKAIKLYETFGFRRSNEGPDNLFGTPLFAMTKVLTIRHAKLFSPSG